MSWMLFVKVVAALLAFCRGLNLVGEENGLSISGYHLCARNETRIVSIMVMHIIPYTVTRPCGGWLLWTKCEVRLYKLSQRIEYKTITKQVTRCCDGYEQVGRYCALPVNRSGEFTAKPGSCPRDGACPSNYEHCNWDIDCPGWQKCCQRIGISLCQNPSSSSNYSEIGRCRFNATVTVKIDYNQLMSKDRGLLNHTRILQAMVTGGLQSDVSVFYLGLWPVHPFRTATSMLMALNCSLSLHTVTSKLHLLLKHIQEVSAVHVEDVDECTHASLHHCPPQAECNNTLGSYRCICRQGFTGDDPSNSGAQCAADVSSTPTTELPAPMNTVYTPASNTQPDLTGNSTTRTFSSSETSTSPTSSVLYDSSTNATPYTSVNSTVVSPLPATTCFPPRITRLQSTNVTGNSFCVYWSSHFQTNQTYIIVLHQQSELINRWEINQTMMEVTGLQPGLLYKVTVTPHACGSQGPALNVWIKTDAHTLNVTAQFTNIKYTSDLKNTSSQAYRNLTESIVKEIYQSLPPDIKALMDSGQVRLVIVGFSPGSVIVNFTIISAEALSQNLSSVSTAVLHSLKNSSKYTVDENKTSITDFDECATGENDCSEWANCSNTWGSYTCSCLEGFIENNSERPGRACEAVVTTTSEAKPVAVSTAPYSEINSPGGPALTSTVSTLDTATVTTGTVVPAAVTSLPATPLLTGSTVTHTMTAVPTVTVSHITPTSDNTTTATPMANTTSALASTNTTMTTAASTTTTAIIPTPKTNSTTMTTITSSLMISTDMTAGTDTNPTSTTTSAPSTTTSVLSTSSSSPMVTTNAMSTTTSAPTISTSVLSTSSSSPMVTTNAMSTTTSAPTISTSVLSTSSSSPMVTTNPTSTTTSAPSTTTSVLSTSSSSPMVTTNAMSTTTSAPTISTSVLSTSSSSPMVTTNAMSTTTSAPTTNASVLSTTSSSPVMTTNPTSTTTSAPSTTTSVLSTSSSSPMVTTNAMSTTTSAPTTNTSVIIGKAAGTATTTSALTTTSPVLSTATSAPSVTSNGTRSTTPAPAPISSALTSTSVVKGDISVECRAAAITVTVGKDFLQKSQIRETDLHLGLKECGVNGGNDTHVQLTVAWDECNTILVKNETYYTVSVILLNNMDPYMSANGTMIVPKVRLQMPIICAYSKKTLISTDFGSMGYDLIKDTIMASGSFQVIVQLMNGTVPLPHNYSLSSDEAVVVQISLNTSTEQIKVIMNKCWATPTPNPADSKSYTFLDNSCSLNPYTHVLTNGNSSVSRVSVQIFSFVGLDMIYLHCLVQICVETGSTTCIPDCLQRTVQSRTTIGRTLASTGPLSRISEETLEEKLDLIHVVGFSCLGVGLALFFIFGFVCIFYWQRNRIGHYNFNTKPKQDNFSHIALDT
ncbi:mucin-5AC [Thalassophryne amazonica]|uniref:mucin-5AC n=1 Tax=Thalassophryne amazonica TaxID=390379 RepID=UPI00147098DC|nr:mucin-5AC [Thalassophryne amazonica]